jgi:hypothetical protein
MHINAPGRVAPPKFHLDGTPTGNGAGLMREGSGESGVQLAVAVFDDWDSLEAALIELEISPALRPTTVMHARSDIPSQLLGLGLLKQVTELRFGRSRQRISCSAGHVAQELSARLSRGAASLADALHDWLGTDRAGRVENHVERGHLVLCVELHTSDDFSVVCGRLVRASPHMVELCNIGSQ